MSFEYQKPGTEFLLEKRRAMLADEPGLGKSRQALMAAQGRTLIIAPAMVLAGGVWQDEVAKWRPDLDATMVSYSSITRREKTGTNASATRPLPMLRPEYKTPWDTVILDEVHNIKERKTTWTKAIMSLESDRAYLLTGTPIPNWAHELFVSLKLIFQDEAGPGARFGSYWRWIGEWFDVSEMWGGKQVGNLLKHRTWLEFHESNFRDRFLQRLRDDVLKDLPPMTMQTVECPMSDSHARVYRALKKDFIAWTDSGEEVVAWTSAAQVVKLAKLCTDVSLVDPSAARRGKFAVLRERLADQAQPSLVVGYFQDTVQGAREVAESLGKRTVTITRATSARDRERAVRGFQAGDFDVMCATIEVISEGLTLTRADTIHRLERSWRPFRNDQVIRRIHRIGQTRPVTVYDYVTPKSIDTGILRVLEKKTDQQVKALRPRDLLRLVDG